MVFALKKYKKTKNITKKPSSNTKIPRIIQKYSQKYKKVLPKVPSFH
jgi:hypothetical protein